MNIIRPGFFFLVCPDSGLIKLRIKNILAEYPLKTGHYIRHIFWADEGLSSQFWNSLVVLDLFCNTNVIILRQAHLLRTEDWNALVGPLARFNPNSFPIFSLEITFEKKSKQLMPKIPIPLTRQPYWAFAQKKNWLWLSPGLNNRTVITFIKNWAKTKNFTFAPGAIEEISCHLPLDAGAIEQELTKIELSLTTDTIPVKAAELISYTNEMEIISFLNALEQGTSLSNVWQQVIRYEYHDDAMLFSFLAIINRELRILWQLYFDEEPISIPPFLIPTKRTIARSLGPNIIAQIFTLILNTEYSIKSGKHSPKQAIALLIANLTTTLTAHKVN